MQKALRRYVQPLFGGLNDADIRLMGQHPIDVLVLQSGGGDHAAQTIGHGAHGKLVDLLAVHVHLGRLVFRRGRVLHEGRAGREGRHAQGFGRAACLQADGQQVIALFQHHGACRVAKQHAGGAVGPVHHGRQGLRRDDQHLFDAAAAEESARNIQRVHKAGARGVDIHRRAAGTQPALQKAAHRGGDDVAPYGRAEDEIKLFGLDPGIRHRLFGRFQGQIGQRFLAENAAFLHAGACGDPFVTGIHDARQIVIGDDQPG